MRIIVCIKQVPSTQKIKIDAQTGSLIRAGVPGMANPCDLNALEEALSRKDSLDAHVTVLSMGPPAAEAVIREAIALGADDGILLCDQAFGGADTLATSYTLAQAVRSIRSFDLIICGSQTTDGETGQVGAQLAWMLDIPSLTYVSEVIELDASRLVAVRELEYSEQTVEMALPGLVTVLSKINTPRTASLRGMMKAKQAKIDLWAADEIEADRQRIGAVGSPTQVRRVFSPPKLKRGELITGSPSQQAQGLVERLKVLGLV